MKIPITLPRQFWFATFSIVLLLALIWVALKSGPLAPIQVTVTQVAKGEVSPALFGIGTVEARRAYLIGPTAAGRVGRVLVDVGDTVQAGQLLAEMDPVDLDARVSSAAAAAVRAKSAVATAQAQIQDMRSRQALAASEARRYVELGRKGFISQSVVDGKLQQQQSADAQLAAAESTLAGARQDLARLDADLEGVKQQRVNIRLAAPTGGVVTSRDAEPGATVVAGQAVLKLVQPDSLWVTVKLDQGRSAGLKTGLPAEITLRSNPGKPLAGKVARVEPVSDSVTEERIAQVAFDLMPQGASIGEMAEVTLRLTAIGDALLIPNGSLRYRGAQAGVWLRTDGQLRFAPVKTGAESLDGKVQVVEGLKAGDEIVVYSERDLGEGSRIKVVASLAGKTQ
ncbi:MAG: efflux RND transporter periplasmic adaptor subunit [Candidatus Ferrigenium altingense]